MMRPYVIPPSPASEPDTERDGARPSSRVDTLPDPAPEFELSSAELEDTQPSLTVPAFEDEAFYDAPTQPGMRLRMLPAHGAEQQASHANDGQWDRVLAAVAHAVRRVFAHSA